MVAKKISRKLKIPLNFDEAVSDFLQVKPPAKEKKNRPSIKRANSKRKSSNATKATH